MAKYIVNDIIHRTLKQKARKSCCTYRISAVAFDRKGDILGYVTNRHSIWNVVERDGVGRIGTGIHAERRLMAQYGKNISSIVICRIGHSGDILPIDPCPVCKKAAEKLGIKIYSVCPGKK